MSRGFPLIKTFFKELENRNRKASPEIYCTCSLSISILVFPLPNSPRNFGDCKLFWVKYVSDIIIKYLRLIII